MLHIGKVPVLNILEEVLLLINLTFISLYNLGNSEDIINYPVSLGLEISISAR